MHKFVLVTGRTEFDHGISQTQKSGGGGGENDKFGVNGTALNSFIAANEKDD